MWPSASGHLAKGHDWWLIRTHPSTYAATVYVYIYIYMCVCYIHTQYISVSKGRGQHHLVTRATTHIFWDEHTHKETYASCGWTVGTKCNGYRVFTCRIAFVPNILPKNLKNSAFGTSTNHLAKRKTRQAHSHEGNFSGQVLGVFSIWLFILDDSFWDFEALLINFKGCQKSSTIEQVKSKRQNKFQKKHLGFSRTAETRRYWSQGKTSKTNKKRIRCNSFKWPNYSCWCLV